MATRLNLEVGKMEEEEIIKIRNGAMQLPDLNIAVSGMAGRFPKSDSINEFEENLCQGTDMINDNDDSRFNCGLWGLPPRAGRLKDLSKFDNEFFGFTVEEANFMDFQLRILYEVVYESIIDSGVNPASLRGSKTGVFFGLHCNEFENALADDPGFKTSGYYAQFALKIAQYFDLRGITVTFDAACASGFVGLHNAVEAIKEGIVEQAIVCSSNIPVHPTGSFIFLQMQMLSPTGYSRFLDARADGYVKSEACVSIFLQRKDIARRNYASIMCTMTSVDGYKKEGITFPSDKSQESLIRQAKEATGISIDHVEYLEAHGTGTPAGDPQEARAIANVYCNPGSRKTGPLLLGSVKTNMGHSEAASGLCALAKVALMLENEIIYKSLHYAQPNANIESLKEGRIKFVDETTKLNGKVVPLSCYGFGGSNVHAILRASERPAIDPETRRARHISDQEPRIVVMFGRTKECLNSFFDQLINLDGRQTKNCLSDDFLALIDGLNANKIDKLMDFRGYLMLGGANSNDEPPRELERGIKRFKLPLELGNRSHEQDCRQSLHIQECQPRECNLVLPGLGSQWSASAAGLTNYKPFWTTIERLASVLEPFDDDLDLIKLLTESGYIAHTICESFVLIIAYEIALINIIRRLKINNLGKIVGHSLGQIGCAYAAGIFDERETILTAYHLGRALDENSHLIEGKVLVLSLDEADTENLIRDFGEVCVSCTNGPQWTSISGRASDIEAICKLCEYEGIMFKIIDCNIALHNHHIMNAQIQHILEKAMLSALSPGGNYSTEKTSWVPSHKLGFEQANAAYFASSLCQKVDYVDAINQLSDDSLVVEVGPCGLFESQLRLFTCASDDTVPKFQYVAMMDSSTRPEESVKRLVASFGQIYQAGATFDLSNFYYGEDKHLLFPARRQTPSISSLFKWNHKQSHFVPRYPAHFGKSSAKSEMPVDLVQDRDKYLSGHCVEGRVLYPATGYLFLVWRIFSFSKREIFDACFHDVEKELMPVEFHDVRLHRAIILGNRVAQIYIQYEEATGRFEIKEGGSVVADGYAVSPTEAPQSLMYESVKDHIRQEKLELTMELNDIYKQFRVSGYDYGETFRNIIQSSTDGRYCKVRYNGHFVAFTDAVLQSLFLAVSQYAPSGGLFLPTKFEYVRFQPEIILAKLKACKMLFDRTEGSLNTQAKREIMTKIMQRESGDQNAENVVAETTADDDGKKKEPEALPECIFETFCDPITGVIITDGVEMRGVKATPAPRRVDNNEVLLESYQFVHDIEDRVDDEPLTRYKQTIEPYIQTCDATAVEILRLLDKSGSIIHRLNGDKTFELNQKQVENRKSILLESRISTLTGDEKNPEYDVTKNGKHTLLSVLDEIKWTIEKIGPSKGLNRVKEIVANNKRFLLHDLIQCTFNSERFMRSIMETVLENTCTKKMKLKVLEVNLDDGLLKEPLCYLAKSVEPSLVLDYSLAHPDLNHLSESKLLPAQNQGFRTFTLKPKELSDLFNKEHHLRNLDLIVYKDISCYSLPKQVIEQNGVSPVLSTLSSAVRSYGFVIVVMRKRLTLGERILLSMSQPELVGLTERELAQTKSGKSMMSLDSKISRINEILSKRYELMLSEAEQCGLMLLSKKADKDGCCILLFRSSITAENLSLEAVANRTTEREPERTLIRITHDNTSSIESWLETLKSCFVRKDPEDQNTEKMDVEQEQQVWLCAVATRQNSISGLIGMMQALRKEVGSSRLRCYYDMHTFKNRDEPIDLEEVERCTKFQIAIKRDLIWNCVAPDGCFGAYRHFTINNFMNHEECRCDNEFKNTSAPIVSGAYVNHATRGDLSSFTWYEGPFKYLSKEEQKCLVKVEYSALNFRDIMLATGRLPLDAIPLEAAMSDCQIGLEFAGYDHFGKRVAGMVGFRSLATHVVCTDSMSLKFQVPDWMSLRDAATLPVVYATSIMALIYRGQIRAGESILIHAGSGGVGQAAIRIASHYGLVIYTSVGSDEKRQFILDNFGPDSELANPILAERIFSSRDCNFEEEILRATGGRGVDLVLNSLADDKLQASVRCLADGGRFLEIGKYDMSMNARLELLQLDVNKTFHGILLDKLFSSDITEAVKSQYAKTLETLRDGVQDGWIKPIKSTVFERHQIEDAFRFMATGKHIGKVLIKMSDGAEDGSRGLTARLGIKLNCIPRFQLSPEKSYLVTGGLGGFGLELVKWLVSQGARKLVLSSRSGLRNGYQRATLNRLQKSAGATLRVVDASEADAASRNGAHKLIQLALSMSPSGQIGGLFHLAMVLKDTLLENMTVSDFELVCRPKVDACVNLDAELRESRIQPDYFVAFSSVTSGKGNAGQSNYAYANSCIERVCELRRQDKLHGLAIQWGAIGDVGVAFENLGGNDIIIGGTIPQRIPSCLTTLGRLLCSPFATCLSVVPVNKSGEGAGEKGDLVAAIMHVLGIKDPSKVGEQATLGELGLDSLMAVEIRQYIEREYDMTLNIQEIRSLTIAKIREISDNGKSAAAKLRAESASPGDAKTDKSSTLRQVQGYTGLVQNGNNKEATNVRFSASSVSQSIDAFVDKNSIAAFVPSLELPSESFRKLNWSKGFSGGRPIFFIPPIHGEFDRLELISSNIRRPCIGLNWTRKLGRARRVEEAVEIYLELLESTNWQTSFGYFGLERTVDIVGYSFGATIAFELMRVVFELAKRDMITLKPGNLVLLDGSPRQIELGSQVLGSMTSHSSMKLAEKVDHLLLAYVGSHVRASSAKVDLLNLKRRLAAAEIESKVEIASTCLVQGLPASLFKDEGEEQKSRSVSHSMEAFCRRYEMINGYKCQTSLPGNCTLIRAERIYLANRAETDDLYKKEDLDLSSVVEGKVNMFIMRGDHETFINGNHKEIGRIISAGSGKNDS